MNNNNLYKYVEKKKWNTYCCTRVYLIIITGLFLFLTNVVLPKRDFGFLGRLAIEKTTEENKYRRRTSFFFFVSGRFSYISTVRNTARARQCTFYYVWLENEKKKKRGINCAKTSESFFCTRQYDSIIVYAFEIRNETKRSFENLKNSTRWLPFFSFFFLYVNKQKNNNNNFVRILSYRESDENVQSSCG